MIELNHIKQVYFLGIGGIGMSALARYFHATGKHVAGYDRTPTDLTRQLSDEGIAVHYEDSRNAIPEPFRISGDTLVIITPAVPVDNEEMQFFRNNGFKMYKRSQVLGFITHQKMTIAVAGTHGKTTVSTMVTHLMQTSGKGCNAFLGGISNNYKSNLVLHPQSEWVVTEADEYDRSFLALYPYAAIVTAMDADHLDIYGNLASMEDAFNGFIAQIHRDGILLLKEKLPVKQSVLPKRVYTYSLEGETDFRAQNIRLVNHQYCFDLMGPGVILPNLTLKHPGRINVENAVAASAMGVLLNLDHQSIRQALESFSGIARRFDYQVNTKNTVYIDDYAHHPREIEATIRSVRELYPNRTITGIFQPHLYTRTRDLAEDFAASLSLLDRLILLDIYPARELPIPGITSEIIFRHVAIADKTLCTKAELLDLLREKKIEVLVTLGAGDIDKYTQAIARYLQSIEP